ncbi:sensor histidine kinase [Georgenia subflava]|uniref:histidine kinase n=2 Tax=Georgenia subflava TaxID=1622177 RepID=A0A6N7EKX6_9MICO|nr:sensor histidine kinase [Georgenia subflava]
MTIAVAVVIAADLEGTGRAGPGAYLFAVAFGGLVLARRRFPRAVLVATVLGIFVYYIFGFPPIGIALPAVAALYSAAELGRTRWAIGAGAVLVVVSAFFRVDEGQPTSYLYSYELITNVALIAAAIALGISVRASRVSREHQERLRVVMAAEQAQAAERRLQAERVRIARDLHDAVGHTMSVISVHAAVAAEAVGQDDDAAGRAIEQVRTATSDTMRELRSTVRLLRSPGASADPPHGATLTGLDALVRSTEEAGIEVTAQVDVPPGVLDSAIDAAAYRIVQESLTNVLRHSGAAHAEVRALIAGDLLVLTITDDGAGDVRGGTAASHDPRDAGHGRSARRDGGDGRGGEDGGVGAPPSAGQGLAGVRVRGALHGGGVGAPPSAGQGLAGMRERAKLLGGELQAGPERGGFVVRAELPVRLVP